MVVECGVAPTGLPYSKPTSPRGMRSTKSRGIIHSVLEKGTARLICDEDFRTLRGILITDNDDTFSIFGTLRSHEDPSTSHEFPMDITIVDGDTADRYELLAVNVTLDHFQHPVTLAEHTVIKIDHPAFKFHTTEVLIGNKADVAIHRFIDPKFSHENEKKVLVGQMTLKVVAQERTAPTTRRLSECLSPSCTEEVIEQTDDFLA
ncbi:unnamed protein product [Bursaphelenchus xylophilus]|uniref:(pine wood nematode) hypothetical protein n=1 Tax=Bursaphelenchus xylophilus TaxID=6326 RepID=A0A1I7S8I4_BURXY|nr:unnamed protein product [Bursaphelenchus xylophilus]CAG9121111.1 unnamed protein product [Bursaphelenchus xylophilus]